MSQVVGHYLELLLSLRKEMLACLFKDFDEDAPLANMQVCVCVRERVCERESGCVCERESVCERVRVRERERVCV